MDGFDRGREIARQMRDKEGPYWDRWVAGRRTALERELQQIYVDLGLMTEEGAPIGQATD
jgi:hypothetical protein